MKHLLPLVASELQTIMQDGRIGPLQPLACSELVQVALSGDLFALDHLVRQGARDDRAFLQGSPRVDWDTLMSLRQIHRALLDAGHPPPGRRPLDYVLLLACARDDEVGRGTLKHCLGRPGWNRHEDYLVDGPRGESASTKQRLLDSLMNNTAGHGRMELLDYLVVLTGGAKQLPVRLGPQKRGVLFSAIRHGHAPCLDYLLECGSDAEWDGEEGRNLLFEAIGAGQENAMHYLVARGWNVDIEHGKEQAMDVLTERRPLNLARAKWLLDRGASPNGAGDGWHGPAEAALSEGDEPFLRLLVERGLKILPVEQIPNVPVPLLVRAGAYGCAWAVPLLLSCGARVDEADGSGHTPLMAASMTGNTPMVIDLLAKGARVDLETSEGLTALALAANAGKIETFLVLMEHHPEGLDATEQVATGPVATWWRRRRLGDFAGAREIEEDTTRLM